MLRESTKVPLLTSYVKSQRLQWFDHVTYKNENSSVRAVIEWQQMGGQENDG